jgi:hypothetical protein
LLNGGVLKYHIEIKPGGYTREEALAEGAGAADAIVVVSIMRDGRPPHQGDVSFCAYSVDSVGADSCETAPSIPDTEMFSAVSMLCKKLGESPDVLDWQREAAKELFETAKENTQARRVRDSLR